MTASIRSEFRKLFSVRSTYIISALALAMVVFFGFYIEGIRANPQSLADPNRLASEVTSAISAVGGLLALVGVLLFTHEYRYNTIMYTLTASNSRTRTLLAKIISVSCFALLASLIVGALAPIMTYLGVHVKGHQLVHQVFPVADLLWRCLFYGWGYAMAALLLAALIRSQVGAIAAVFLIPTTAETLLSLLLKNNAIYMPFTALGQVVGGPQGQGAPPIGHLTPGKGALVFTVYLLIGWIVAWILFLRRDAN